MGSPVAEVSCGGRPYPGPTQHGGKRDGFSDDKKERRCTDRQRKKDTYNQQTLAVLII